MPRLLIQIRWLLSCLHYALVTAKAHRPTVREVMRYGWQMRNQIGY